MKELWKLKDPTVTTVRGVVEKNTGMSADELLSPKSCFVQNLKEAAEKIRKAIDAGQKFYIYGDYDADGVTSTAILVRLLDYFHAEVIARLPKRFSEGYGLNAKVVDSILDANPDIVITIDNGIVAVEEIATLKSHGIDVVIIDHHLRRDDGAIPNADVIVDPHVIEGSDFDGFCGAGLAYKLASQIVGTTAPALLNSLQTLACIGTIADVMPLLYENRIIVKEGLQKINAGKSVVGIHALLGLLGLYEIDTNEVAFKLGPIINAAGRMKDDGAELALALLTTDSYKDAEDIANCLIAINSERQATVKENLATANNMIASQCLFGDNPLIVYTTKEDALHFHEGVVGILAGKLAETFCRPTVVLTEVEDGVLKGSGRSYGTIHLKELLDTVSDTLLGYGGHAGAAGIKVSKECLDDFIVAIQGSMAAFRNTEDIKTEKYYDMEISAADLNSVWTEMQAYAPFGESNPRLIFKVTDVNLTPKAGKFTKTMGEAGQHLKMFGNGFELLAFDGAQDYADLGTPTKLNVIGALSTNSFGGKTMLQIEASDFEEATKSNPSSLASLLAATMRKNGF